MSDLLDGAAMSRTRNARDVFRFRCELRCFCFGKIPGDEDRSSRRSHHRREIFEPSSVARARGAHDIMRPSELISRPLRTDYFPLVPKLLPTPVTKSYPDLQLKLPAVPETVSRKSSVPIFE